MLFHVIEIEMSSKPEHVCFALSVLFTNIVAAHLFYNEKVMYFKCKTFDFFLSLLAGRCPKNQVMCNHGLSRHRLSETQLLPQSSGLYHTLSLGSHSNAHFSLYVERYRLKFWPAHHTHLSYLQLFTVNSHRVLPIHFFFISCISLFVCIYLYKRGNHGKCHGILWHWKSLITTRVHHMTINFF